MGRSTVVTVGKFNHTVALVAWVVAAIVLAAPGPGAQEGPMDESGARAFDWLFGKWKIENRMLAERLGGSSEWKTFAADYEAWPILRGMGNQDRFVGELGGAPFEGMSLRYYNPVTERWSIHWLDTQALTQGEPDLAEVMVGEMHGDTGEFFGTTEHAGREVRVRFLWQIVSDDRARWEQAFSPDDGESWEVNWITEFTRTGAAQ